MKLTKEMRYEMERSAVAQTFTARDKAYALMRTEFGDALYKHICGKDEATARKLPRNWCNYTQDITINADGFSWHQSSMPTNKFHMSKERPIPHVFINDDITVKGPHPLLAKLEAIRKEFHALADAKENLRRKLNALLAPCTTLKKLQEFWPEGKKFHPKDEERAGLPMPYEAARDVNAIMGLTKKPRALA